ncbi:MAG TPA: PEGA domain-containing protein [Nitrospira sp.]|nr:PEGA domain-containing protein [Nitrospira sp.]
MPDTLSHRNAYRRVGVAVLTVCYLNLTACSIFGGSSQSLTVNSDPPGANVLINGTLAGTTPLQHQVPRRGDLTVEVQKAGFKPQSRMTGRKLSSVGIVDVIGGALFLLPLLGLIAPGAWEQDPGIIGITLEPEHPQPAQPQ